jgi:hypothetical protein
MKVILKSLTLTNFMGEKSRTTTFNDDVTTISGGNGLGKTRHFNAFTWLLFGKDILDRKDYEVRTRVNNQVMHKVECSVAATLIVDGEELHLKRESVEDWVKPRTKQEEVFKGNHNECWWNDAPIKVGEFDKRIADIIDTPIFKMLTNPLFFANMPWKAQRNELFKLAGTITDAELAQRKPEFRDLVETLTNKSLNDFKAEIAAKIKKLNAKKEEINPRIDQTQKMMPDNDNFAEIEKQIAQIDGEITTIDQAMSDNAARVRQAYEAEQAKQRQIYDIIAKRDALVRNAENAASEAASNANSHRRELQTTLTSKKRELAVVQRGLKSVQDMVANYESDIVRMNKDLDAMRKTWETIDAEQYTGSDICFHCHQPLPAEMRETNLKNFNLDKEKRQSHIEEDAENLAKRIAAATASLEESRKQVAQQSDDAENLANEIKTLEATIEATPEVAPAAIVPENVDGYAALTKQADDIKATVSTSVATDDGNAEYKTRKVELNAQRDALKARLSKREQIADANKMIAELEEYGRDLAQQIAELEQQQFQLGEFTRCKIDECESRINNLFKYVKFKLFDYTIEGNEYETCYPLVDGVPFGAANTAGQINAGLDIINSLCHYYGLNAPIFIDKRESINDLVATESQIINLVVTKEPQLTIK